MPRVCICAGEAAMVLTRDRVIYHVSLGEQVEIEGRPTGRYQLYLVSYDLKTGALRDHGPIFTEGRRALWTDSAALDEASNTLWLLADVEVTDPVTTWQLNNIRRGLGANHTLGGNLFEMQLLEIPLE